ncbi:MAG TPA: hypothetical protein VKW08_09405 [Xanthobacteraceae bacterium]|nr:hypothetical protein [Xanthobacteraceae bacterium]
MTAGTIVMASMMTCFAQTAENARYPDWKGAWERFVPKDSVASPSGLRTSGGQPSFDQTKPWGAGQEASLTPEYQKVLEDSLADQAKGGQGNNFDRAVRCLPNGMPLMMTAFLPLELVVTPDTTYVLTTDYMYFRRIFTDGRDWPRSIQPTFAGYSIGRWIDQDRNGTYSVLEVETRGFTGPRVFDATGLPLHSDNQSIFKERIHRDKSDPNVLHDEITVIDHALTRPWTVDKKYLHNPNPRPNWIIGSCAESNMLVGIGRDAYYLSADGRLMPIEKDQAAPDLRYFKQDVKQPQH